MAPVSKITYGAGILVVMSTARRIGEQPDGGLAVARISHTRMGLAAHLVASPDPPFTLYWPEISPTKSNNPEEYRPDSGLLVTRGPDRGLLANLSHAQVVVWSLLLSHHCMKFRRRGRGGSQEVAWLAFCPCLEDWIVN